MAISSVYNDFNFRGTVQFTGTVNLPSNTVDENDVKSAAQFEHTNLKHRMDVGKRYASTAAPSSGDEVMIVAYQPCRLVAGRVLAMTAATSSAAASLDVMKSTGGAYSSMLGSTFVASSTLSAKTAGSMVMGSTSATYLATGNHAIIRVATSGTGAKLPKGLAVDLRFVEDGQ